MSQIRELSSDEKEMEPGGLDKQNYRTKIISHAK